MMPSPPYLVSGTVTNSKSTASASAIISFETATGKANVIANSSGQYTFDLAEIGYTAGESVEYIANSKYYNEILASSFTVSGESKTLNVTLIARENVLPTLGARGIQIANIGGYIVNRANPLPVEIITNFDK